MDNQFSTHTALALQIRHRDSIDFDFFSLQPFSTEELFRKIESIFASQQIIKTQEEKDTLSIVTGNGVKLSFFTYPYKLIKPLLDQGDFKMASIEDIGAMKLSAITSRSVWKDYVDLYFILHRIQLPDLLAMTQEKFPTIDLNLILKSLVYFDDVQAEPILFKGDVDINLESVKYYLTDEVNKYLKGKVPLTFLIY